MNFNENKYFFFIYLEKKDREILLTIEEDFNTAIKVAEEAKKELGSSWNFTILRRDFNISKKIKELK